jgi:ribosome-associated protein
MTEDFQEQPSRTARKRAAHQVEELAWQLVEVPEAFLGGLPLSEEVAADLRLARATGGRGARSRQVRHLAAQLRRRPEEAQALAAALAGTDEVHRREQALFHSLEALREELCGKEDLTEVLQRTLAVCPDLDREAAARLARSVRTTGDRRAYRELFRLLRTAAAKNEGPAEGGS